MQMRKALGLSMLSLCLIFHIEMTDLVGKSLGKVEKQLET